VSTSMPTQRGIPAIVRVSASEEAASRFSMTRGIAISRRPQWCRTRTVRPTEHDDPRTGEFSYLAESALQTCEIVRIGRAFSSGVASLRGFFTGRGSTVAIRVVSARFVGKVN
jgi:hypothetical protein